MNAKRILPTTPSLIAVLALAACDPELDGVDYARLSPEELSAELSAELELLEDDELEPLPGDSDSVELEAPGNEQTVSSCDLGLPGLVIAGVGGATNAGTASGALSGIPSGSYYFEVTASPTNPAPLQYWLMEVDNTLVDSSVSSLWPPFNADAGDSVDLFMQAFASGQPGWIYEFDVELHSYPDDQLICTGTTALELQPDCGDVDNWWTQPWPHPWYDTANCYVAPLPVGATSFVWGNSWYVTPTSGTQCSIGSYDGANCYIGSAPWGQSAFIWNGNMYYTL